MSVYKYLTFILIASAALSLSEGRASDDELSPTTPVHSRQSAMAPLPHPKEDKPNNYEVFRAYAQTYNELVSDSKDKQLSKEQRQEMKVKADKLYQLISGKFPDQLERALRSSVGNPSKASHKKKPRGKKTWIHEEETEWFFNFS